MSQVFIPGAVMRKISIANKSPKAVEINVEADWADSFCQEFKIQTPPEQYRESDLVLALNMVNFILTPEETALQKYEIDVNCGQAKDFKYVPRLTKKGTVKSRELHFKISAGGPGVAATLENYIDHVGDHPGTMKLVFNEQVMVDDGGDEDADGSDDDQLDLTESHEEEGGGVPDGESEEVPDDAPGTKKIRGRRAKAK